VSGLRPRPCWRPLRASPAAGSSVRDSRRAGARGRRSAPVEDAVAEGDTRA
jgi:hypothetical protein